MMFDDIYADLLHANKINGRLSVSRAIQIFFTNLGFQSLVVYRLGRSIRRLRDNLFLWPIGLVLYPVYWILDKLLRVAYDIRLEQNADISPGLYIGHFGGIFVSRSSIGRDSAIQQQVELRPTKPEGAGPRIGSGVWVGAHAKIIGDISVGDGATIGAGAIVTTSVPPNSLVLGNPARITSLDYDNKSFL